MKIFTKESLIEELTQLAQKGWISNARAGNSGGIGNTLEDYLGITENNLPLANAAEWELKTQAIDTTSLVTLFHKEPSPRALRFVPKIFIPKFGWPHTEAGTKYAATERRMSLTVNGGSYTDRGFIVKVNRDERKVEIDFDSSKVKDIHIDWLKEVEARLGYVPKLDPKPYWGFDDLNFAAGSKLTNCFFVQADRRVVDKVTQFWYRKVTMLQTFKVENLLRLIESGNVYVDIDARTGHNHGTKFRIQSNKITNLYETAKVVVSV